MDRRDCKPRKMAFNSSFQNGALLSERDRRARDKDAGRSATGATEDTASCRPARTRRPKLYFETSPKVGVLLPQCSVDRRIRSPLAQGAGSP